MDVAVHGIALKAFIHKAYRVICGSERKSTDAVLLAWGARGSRFESYHADQISYTNQRVTANKAVALCAFGATDSTAFATRIFGKLAQIAICGD